MSLPEHVRTVLLFAHECAPFNRPESTIGAQRPAHFAKHLAAHGWRAIVLCCDDSARGAGWSTDAADSVRAAVRGADPSEPLVIATPSLPHDGLIDRWWRDLSARSLDRGPLTLARRALTLAKFFTGDYSQAWQPCARAAARVIASEARLDACIGEHSPDAGIFLARWFAEEHDVPWVADFRDPMLFGFAPPVRPWLEPFARRMLATASAVVSVTPGCVEIDERVFRRPGVLITNGFDPDEFPMAGRSPRLERFTIAYTGSVWLPESLRVFLDGLAELRRRLPDAVGGVRFAYRGNAAELVMRLAAEAGVADMVDAKGQVPRSAALALIQSADLLLLLAPASHPEPYWSRGVYPGKCFEYFGARRPIVCVPGDGGDLDALLTLTRTGISIATPHAVAEYLLAAHGARADDEAVPYAPDEELLKRFTRQHGAAQLASVLDRACADYAAHVAHRLSSGTARPHSEAHPHVGR